MIKKKNVAAKESGADTRNIHPGPYLYDISKNITDNTENIL